MKSTVRQYGVIGGESVCLEIRRSYVPEGDSLYDPRLQYELGHIFTGQDYYVNGQRVSKEEYALVAERLRQTLKV